MDLPELFLRKNQEELYANMGKTEEQIKNLITRDKQIQKSKLRPDQTRDISHLKDKLKSSRKVPPLHLPTELQNLKSMMQNSNSRGMQIVVSPSGVNHLTCTHRECIERVSTHNSSRKPFSKSSTRKLSSLNSSPILDLNPLSEREPLGSPTGIQDIESLNEWFRHMKTQCVDEESTRVVYTMCAREILRQVTVHNKLRGKLLEEIIEMQPYVFGKQWEKLNNEFTKYREEQENFIQTLQKKYEDDLNRKESELKALALSVKQLKTEKEETLETLEKYKKSLGKLQSKFLENEDIWKSRLLNFVEDMHKNRRGSNTEARIPTLELLKLKQQALASKNQDLNVMIESLSQINEDSLKSEENFNRFKNELIQNDQKMIRLEDKILEKQVTLNLNPKFDQSVQVTGHFSDSQINTDDINENPTTDQPLNPLENKPEHESEKKESEPDSLNLKTNESKEDIPLIFIENSAGSILFPENDKETEKEAKMLIEQTNPLDNINQSDQFKSFEPLEPDASNIFHQIESKIHEAPSFAEESRNNLLQPEGTFFDFSKQKYQSDQNIQTEDILFQRYLDKVQNIEEIIANAKPEEVQQIQNAIYYLLQNDMSNSQSSQRRVSFKNQKAIKRSNSDKLLAIIEPIQRTLINATPDPSRSSSPAPVKDLKNQVSDLVNSINYLTSAIFEKQQNLMNIEKKIQQNSSILNILSKKKTEKSSNIGERKSSINQISDSSSLMKSSRIKKKMTEGLESIPWDEGYEVGYGDGKIQGFLKALEKIQETDLTEELDPEDIEANDSRPLKRKSSKGKIITRFMEFNFHIPTKSKVKKIHPGPIIIERFLNRPLDRVKMRSTLSRKNLNKIFPVIYNSALARVNLDNSTSLVEVTYDEFYGRYGLKSVCDKKFLEFVASVVSNSEFKRCMMFMRLIRFGEVVSSYSYSKYSLVLYLNCYQYINLSKLGIYFSTDDEDKIMVPLIRINECIKEKLDSISDKGLLTGILSKIEQKSIIDPKKINPGGLVELELALEIVLDLYEKYINKIWKGISICLKSLGQQGKHTVLAVDFYLIGRLLGKNFKDLAKEVNIEDMYMMCIRMNIGNEAEVLKAAPSYTKNELFDRIVRYKEKILEFIDGMKGLEEKNGTFELGVWRVRFEIMENYLDSDVFLANLAWKMYELEISRLTNEISFSS